MKSSYKNKIFIKWGWKSFYEKSLIKKGVSILYKKRWINELYIESILRV